jgi:hypothetical protein
MLASVRACVRSYSKTAYIFVDLLHSPVVWQFVRHCRASVLHRPSLHGQFVKYSVLINVHALTCNGMISMSILVHAAADVQNAGRAEYCCYSPCRSKRQHACCPASRYQHITIPCTSRWCITDCKGRLFNFRLPCRPRLDSSRLAIMIHRACMTWSRFWHPIKRAK